MAPTNKTVEKESTDTQIKAKNVQIVSSPFSPSESTTNAIERFNAIKSALHGEGNGKEPQWDLPPLDEKKVPPIVVD